MTLLNLCFFLDAEEHCEAAVGQYLEAEESESDSSPIDVEASPTSMNMSEMSVMDQSAVKVANVQLDLFGSGTAPKE